MIVSVLVKQPQFVDIPLPSVGEADLGASKVGLHLRKCLLCVHLRKGKHAAKSEVEKVMWRNQDSDDFRVRVFDPVALLAQNSEQESLKMTIFAEINRDGQEDLNLRTHTSTGVCAHT